MRYGVNPDGSRCRCPGWACGHPKVEVPAPRTISAEKQQDLTRRFTHHPVTPAKQDKYVELRAMGLELAEKIAKLVPDGREQSLALTSLEETIMWANAGIARAGN